MSSNVGLSTPRGSGTSGYVQRNLSTLKPRDAGFGAPYPGKDHLPPKQRKPDRDILEHDRRREIEVKVLELQDRLEDEGKLDEEATEEACEKLRRELGEKMDRGKAGAGEGSGRNLKMHQVHELAEVKIRESERLRRALGLRDGDVGVEGEVNGNEHPMARQERRKREEEIRKEVERNEAEKREKERQLELKEIEARRQKEREKERRRDRSRERRRRDSSSSISRSRSRSRDRERRRR